MLSSPCCRPRVARPRRVEPVRAVPRDRRAARRGGRGRRSSSTSGSPRAPVPTARCALVRELAGAGGVLCSHGDVITELLSRLERSGVDLGNDPRCEKGSVWALELDGEEVVTARYLPPPSVTTGRPHRRASCASCSPPAPTTTTRSGSTCSRTGCSAGTCSGRACPRRPRAAGRRTRARRRDRGRPRPHGHPRRTRRRAASRRSWARGSAGSSRATPTRSATS